MTRDDQAYTAFAAGAQPALRRTAYLMCGDWHRASDLTQEALIKVYLAWPRLERRGTDLVAYARKAVVTTAIDQARRRSSTERPHAVEDDASDGDFSSGVVEREALADALDTLGPRQRACVVLRFFEDLSIGETARILGCSEGTVKSQTSRALDGLRLRLSDIEVTS